MKIRLGVLALAVIFMSSSVRAEYYLVYPMESYAASCGHKVKKVKHHHVAHKKPVKKKYVHRKRSTYKVEVMYPTCGCVATCSPCGGCGCRSRCAQPGYVVYTARPSSCVTYQEVEYGDYYYGYDYGYGY